MPRFTTRPPHAPGVPLAAFVTSVVIAFGACGGAPSSAAPASFEPAATASELAATSASPSLTATEPPTPTQAPSQSVAPVVTAQPAATGAPTRSPTPAPTASPARTADPTLKPTARPTAKPTPAPTVRPTVPPTPVPVVIALEAVNFAFSPVQLRAPAGAPFAIRFTNSDAAIPHNVTIATAGGASQFNGSIINGVASITYQVPALAAGTYHLGCIVHPAMTGSLSVD